MTLNLTVASERCIYQCADFRLVDIATGQFFDFDAQKIQAFTTFKWSATVCFAGVGRTRTIDVSDWLSQQIASVGGDDSFGVLIDKLLEAQLWLHEVPHPHNRHSFSVGAFIGSRPEFVLISNFEDLDGNVASAAGPLKVYRTQPGRPTTYVSGDVRAVTRPQRRLLARLAMRDPAPTAMYEALVRVNVAAAHRSDNISEACYTTHIRLTGEGGGSAYGTEGHPLKSVASRSPFIDDVIRQLLDEQYGVGGGSVRGTSFVRSDASKEFHLTQLREKPNDATVHSNYGAFLQDNEKDLDGAEGQYKKALDIDPNHVSALGNLANVQWKRGDEDGAESLYRRALAEQVGDPNVTLNYAKLLRSQARPLTEIVAVMKTAIAIRPDHGELRKLLADVYLQHGEPTAALAEYQAARPCHGDQAAVESGFSWALQMSGAPAGECIGAYRVAIALNPSEPNLRLNLAQMLFVTSSVSQAIMEMDSALRLGLESSAEIEAQFYGVCHIEARQKDALIRLQQLIDGGARLNWNVRPNIDVVRASDPARAEVLQRLADNLSVAGEDANTVIKALLTR